MDEIHNRDGEERDSQDAHREADQDGFYRTRVDLRSPALLGPEHPLSPD